ncbi:ComEC/Rec2 family competence protein [Paenibacillus sp. IITD108]|uniref:ComEC/Rec2 family competence protein n=1 Tax=Paenibacillus sp. IITD108 TaxID=3116649 RepID=UPI002F423CF2
MESVKLNKSANSLSIHSFGLNTWESCQLGLPHGQPADSYLITIQENNKTLYMLIDGGKKGHGKEIILPYLLSNNIHHLDIVILTHPHLDHFGGMIDLLVSGKLTIGSFIYAPIADRFIDRGPDDLNYAQWLQFKKVLNDAKKAIGEIIIPEADQLGIGQTITRSLQLTLIALPDKSLLHEPTNLNDVSIVFRLDFGKFSALFTGDCGAAQAELIMKSEYKKWIDDVVLLKASHHGGDEATNRDFIAANNSKIVLIPCNYTVVDYRPAFIENLHAYTRNGAIILREDFALRSEVITDGAVVHCRVTRSDCNEEYVIVL